MNALWAQTRNEVVLSLRQGEQLLVALGIPILLLVFLSQVDLLPRSTDRPIDGLAPAMLALAVMSSSMVSLGIGTGFERHYGVLKRLGVTPLGRPRLLGAKVMATFGTEVVQVHGGRRQRLALRGPEVHRLQGGARDVLEGVRHRHEPAQDPGTTLGRLIEEESRPGIARWHRFGVDLPFLKLEGRLDAP